MTHAAAARSEWMIFMGDLAGGGAQRAIVNVLRFWPQGFPVPLLVLARREGAGTAWLDETVRVHDLGGLRLRAALLPLRALVRAHRPRLLMATMAVTNVVAAAATRGLGDAPTLVLSEVNAHRAHDGISAWQRPLIGWALRRASRVITQSHGLGAEMVATYGLDPARVFGIHNPIDIAAVRQAATAPPPFPPGGPVVLGAGRLVRQKGFDVLLRAFASLDRPDARLAIIGKGPLEPELRAQAEALGIGARLLLPGHVAAPEAWYAHAACFVLSSRWEGFGNVVVEALAAGAPTVATDCPHGPGEIVRSGETGLLVPVDDAGALSAAIRRMLDEPALAAACRAAAAADVMRFDARRIARQYAETMAGAISR